MNLDQYLTGRGKDKKAIILRDLAKLTFTPKCIISLPGTTTQYEFMQAYYQDMPKVQTLYNRVKAIGNRWCQENCSDPWVKMRNPMAWGFENPAEALLFKFAMSL